MRQILAFLASLAVALLVTAAGLYFDVKTLAAFGFALVGFVVILWLFEWGRQPSAKVPATAPPETAKADSKDEDQRRENVISNGYAALYAAQHDLLPPVDSNDIRRGLPVIGAALLSLKKEFNLPLPQGVGKSLRDTQIYARYLEQVLPMLSAGHIEVAREIAESIAKMPPPDSRS